MLNIFFPSISRKEVGIFTFEPAEDHNEGLPFNYWLTNKRDNKIISFFINNFIDYGDYVYFTYIDGGLEEDFCYSDNHLKLGRINLETNKIEGISPDNYGEIYHKINKIKDRDKEWLLADFNKCKNIGMQNSIVD